MLKSPHLIATTKFKNLMNGFQKRSIQPWKKRSKSWIRSHIILSIAIVFVSVFALKGIVGAINLGNPFSVKQIVISAVSESIETDDYGHTNILLIGVGGEGHDGGTLTDTMILASIDYKEGLISMLSIPRDIYVENDIVGWGTRINSVYEYVAENNDLDYDLGMQELRKEIEGITGAEINYYAKIDFSGFVEIVDALGGITINLDEDLVDPYYPTGNLTGDIYETFSMSAGEHKLDGETALKYVRSRYTTSDFDRAKRQQEVISAMKEKATSIGFLINPAKIKNTLAVLANNFETDLTLSQMLNFASLAADFNGESIISEVLSDDIWAAGGFLYPPEREAYGGAFVLIPYAGEGDFSEVHAFTNILSHYPQIINDKVSIQILNGTGESGLAGLTSFYLERYGFDVIDTENALSKDTQETRIWPVGEINEITEETMDALTTIIDAEELNEMPEEYSNALWNTDAEIMIELGSDFYQFYLSNSDLFYYEFLY